MIKFLQLFLLIFSVFSMSVFGQNPKIDSIQNLLEKSRNDVEKTSLLNEIADLYKNENPQLTKEFANRALVLSKKINNTKEEGRAYINLGNYSIISGNYKAALDYFRQAKDLFEEGSGDDNQKELARVYGSIGIVFSEQSSYGKALEFHLKAVKIYESLNDEQKLARVYNNIGIVYKAQKENFKALKYFLKAQNLQEKLKDPAVGTTTTNIGNIYLDQQDYTKAIEYYNQAEKQFEKNTDLRGLGELYNSLGIYYQQTDNQEKAVDSWNRALDSFNKIEDKFGISDTYYYLGKFYYSNKDYPQAINFTQKANDLAKELSLLEMLTLSEKQLRDIYESSGNYQLALQHGKIYDELRDSLMNYQNIRKSIQSEMDFEFDKKESLHREEQHKQEIVFEEQGKRYRMQLIFGTLLALLCFGLVFLFYNRYQLKKTLTLQKNLAEYEQKALHLQMNPHFVFNCLGSISSFIVQNGNDSAIKYLGKFSKLMRLTLEYSKESLIPVDKEIEALQNYLELEQLRFNKVFDFSINKNENIEDDLALPPLLIQPFVENAIMHGLIPKKEHGFLSVDFSTDENHLICTIKDNGIGIEKSKQLKEHSVSVHKSMALDIIEKRLKMIENSTSKPSLLSIEEMKDETGYILGTKVVLKLPIQYYSKK